MSLTVQECITWLEFARPECASDAEKMDAVITHLRTIAEPIRCDNPVDHGEREGGQDDDRTVAGSLGSPPMTDRDALIERCRQWAMTLSIAADPFAWAHSEDLEALISLASPSPAQTEGWRPIATAPKEGTPVLLFFPQRYQGNGGVSWGCFVDGEWLDSQAFRDDGATHWMPLPAPPAPRRGLACLLCGRENRDPRPWDASSSICPDCEDKRYSPSPAQTEAPNSSADGDLAAANPQPGEGRAGSPAQWPEDDGGHEWAESTIGPGNWQCRLCGIDSSKAGTEGKYLCEAKKRPALATLPPPEGPLSSDSIGKLPDERVKGLVEALAYFVGQMDSFREMSGNQADAYYHFVKGQDAAWTKARSAIASYRGGA